MLSIPKSKKKSKKKQTFKTHNYFLIIIFSIVWTLVHLFSYKIENSYIGYYFTLGLSLFTEVAILLFLFDYMSKD